MSQYGASDPPRAATTWLLAPLVGVVTFAAFAGYAFLTPAVYRTSALIEVWPSAEAAPPKLDPLEASRRLHEAVLDSAVLERLAEERAPGGSAEAKSQLARAIESALQIDTVDARTFTVSFRDFERARTESSCNWLAERVVERAPRVLAPDSSAEVRSIEAERRRRASAVQAFLAAHPGLGATGPSVVPSNEAIDEPSSAALRAQLQQLLESLARAREASESMAKRGPVLQARLVTPASASFWPIEPDRPRWLLIGLLAALGSAALAAFLGRLRLGDMSESTPPPGMSSHPPAADTSSYPPFGSSSYPPPRPESPYPPAAGHSAHTPPAGTSAVPTEMARLSSSSYPPALPPTTSSSPPSNGQPIVPTRVVSSHPPSASAEPVRISDGAPAGSGRPGSASNEGDRVTPVSVYPPPTSATQSDRPLRSVLEVNAGLPATDKRSSAPAPAVLPRGQSARTTHVLGSPIPPIIAPGSRRSLSVGSAEQSAAAPVSTTGYSYVSTAPPNAGPSSHPRGALVPTPPTRVLDQALANDESMRRSSSAPPAGKDASVVSVQRTPVGWRADLSLLPESRRHLCDEIYPFAVESCCVVGVLGGADTADVKSRLAAELALALAESGHTRVLLLEADFERCDVRRLLRVEMPLSAGFSEQMKSRIGARTQRPWVVLECSTSLHVLAEGGESAPELVLTRTFEDCLSDLRRYYDFVVVDGPLMSNTHACRAVHDVVDRLVFSQGRLGPSELAEITALLPNKRISVIPAFG